MSVYEDQDTTRTSASAVVISLTAPQPHVVQPQPLLRVEGISRNIWVREATPDAHLTVPYSSESAPIGLQCIWAAALYCRRVAVEGLPLRCDKYRSALDCIRDGADLVSFVLSHVARDVVPYSSIVYPGPSLQRWFLLASASIGRFTRYRRYYTESNATERVQTRLQQDCRMHTSNLMSAL